MISIIDLWMPILLAGVLCWIASALIHMLIKYHNADYKELENDEDVSAVLGAKSPKPALYSMPYCDDMKKMGEEPMLSRFAKGPVAMITVLPNGMPPMGKLLSQQLAFFVLGSLLIAYVTSLSFGTGVDSGVLFHLVFVVAFLAYGWAEIPFSIWMGQPWSNCVRYLLDALIYAAVTACVFVWLWP